MAEENNDVFYIPKIKKTHMLSKILLDPADLNKGIPQTPLPELTQQGMILALNPQQAPLAKLSPDGMIKLNIKYNAESVELIDRYIEVKVIDNFQQFWVGIFFGFTVRGTKGEGEVRGCRVLRIEGKTIIAECITEGGLPTWKKFENKVHEILKRNQS